MNEEKKSQKEEFLLEVQKQILHKGLKSEMQEDGRLHVKWNNQPLCEVDALGRAQDLTVSVLIHCDCHQNRNIFILSAPVAPQVDTVYIDVWIFAALQRAVPPGLDIIICDPEAEYFPLVHRLGGQVIKISPTSSQYVNPMDMSLNYSEDDNPLALKSDFILSFCELAAGGRNGLEPVEKTVIDRAVRVVYRPYLADPKPENIPILGDLYDEIKRQPEPEAQRIAAALELYVHGSLNVFNHRTNVDINNRLVCFDIKELGKQLKNLGMLVIQDQVWNRVTVNRSEGKSTRYYVDEFHLLLRGEVGSWSVEIWKRFRKWGGIPTGITQNIKDLLASPEIENIFENSDFIYLLNQASGDRKILCERLNISTQQAAHISNSGPGQGLIFFGNVILPFVDDFPKDNELYSIMTTKPGEVV